MTVDQTLLTKLETLSHLKVDEGKREEIIGQLQSILSFVENLSELDTQGQSTKFLMSDEATTLREDIPVSKTDIADAILEHAHKSNNHSFVVPKIIE